MSDDECRPFSADSGLRTVSWKAAGEPMMTSSALSGIALASSDLYDGLFSGVTPATTRTRPLSTWLLSSGSSEEDATAGALRRTTSVGRKQKHQPVSTDSNNDRSFDEGHSKSKGWNLDESVFPTTATSNGPIGYPFQSVSANAGSTDSLPADNVSTLNDLVPVSCLPERFRCVFPFPIFNKLQSRCFSTLINENRSVVISAPTGSGKTALFELAIVRLLAESEKTATNGEPSKIVYIAPMKALCSERTADWTAKLAPVGLNVCELTGDTDVTVADADYLETANLIVTTPEKWDSVTRKYTRDQRFIRSLRLLLIDEIHIVSDEQRGATLEAVLTRMKTLHCDDGDGDDGHSGLRFVAVSATLPNISDVADWLTLGAGWPAHHLALGAEFRPVKLNQHVLGYPSQPNKSPFVFVLNLTYKLPTIIDHYSNQKPTLLFCATRKLTVDGCRLLSNMRRYRSEVTYHGGAETAQFLNEACRLCDAKLRDYVLSYGMGYHHAGLDYEDRRIIERLFSNGLLPVLFSTTTLALGVNLPAHLVIILGTTKFSAGSSDEYTESELLQMMGRAGRPQFDREATAIIMTRSNMKTRYENLITGRQPVESRLASALREHLNAEVVLGTIGTAQQAIIWLRSTFYFIRLRQNPSRYGCAISYPLSLEQATKFVETIVLNHLNALCSHQLLKLSQPTETTSHGTDNAAVPTGAIEPATLVGHTELGCLVARHNIAFETFIAMKGALKGNELIPDLLRIVSACSELNDVALRTNERKLLNELNTSKTSTTIRYPLDSKIKTRQLKVNCLIQTQLGGLPLTDFGLCQDQTRIFRVAVRITKFIREYLFNESDEPAGTRWKNGLFRALHTATMLAKSVSAKIWHDSKLVVRQLCGIGPAFANSLAAAGYRTFQDVLSASTCQLECAVSRHPPFGSTLQASARTMPQWQLKVKEPQEPFGHKSFRVEVELANWRDMSTIRRCFVLIGDINTNRTLFRHRITSSMMRPLNGVWTRTLTLPRFNTQMDVEVHLVDLEIAGADSSHVLSLKPLQGRGQAGSFAAGQSTGEPLKSAQWQSSQTACGQSTHSQLTHGQSTHGQSTAVIDLCNDKFTSSLGRGVQRWACPALDSRPALASSVSKGKVGEVASERQKEVQFSAGPTGLSQTHTAGLKRTGIGAQQRGKPSEDCSTKVLLKRKSSAEKWLGMALKSMKSAKQCPSAGARPNPWATPASSVDKTGHHPTPLDVGRFRWNRPSSVGTKAAGPTSPKWVRPAAIASSWSSSLRPSGRSSDQPIVIGDDDDDDDGHPQRAQLTDSPEFLVVD